MLSAESQPQDRIIGPPFVGRIDDVPVLVGSKISEPSEYAQLRHGAEIRNEYVVVVDRRQ